MKRLLLLTCMLLIISATYYSCDQSADPAVETDAKVPENVLSTLTNLGFDVNNQAPIVFEDGYLVEGDIFLTDEDLDSLTTGEKVPEVEHYRTNNLVKHKKPKVFSVFLANNFDPIYSAAVNEAIARYNAQGLAITFVRTNVSAKATIRIKRLTKRYENLGVLGSAGFPTRYGTPYGTIKMHGRLQSFYGIGTNGIATIIAHEMGHCIGFRHTDFFNRAISCGGTPTNEGAGGVGANHIEGTPTGATNAAKSWMLACTDGGDRPFNTDDRIALKALYKLPE